MKKILYALLIPFLFMGCAEKYELDTTFTGPGELTGPTALALDVTSTDNIVLSWTGATASDGSYLLYEVLFDVPEGDFSEPIHRQNGDSGGESSLTITHSDMNIIARKAGIEPEATGDVKWTVVTSKGGESEMFNPAKTITLTRPAGMSIIPDKLFLYGSATEYDGAGGREFRRAGDGIFEIYTTLPQAGKIYFAGSTEVDAPLYYINGEEKLAEGEGTTDMEAFTAPRRITVNFNNLSMTVSDPVDQIKLIWADSWLDIDPVHNTFVYEEGGIFRLSDCVLAARHWHPGWGPTHPGSTDARYYFQVLFGQNWWHWRRMDGISDQQPAADEPLSFFEINTTAPWANEQWTSAWMLRSALHDKTADVVIYTNKEGMVVHQFENVR